PEVLRHLDDFFIAEGVEIGLRTRGVVDLLQVLAHFLGLSTTLFVEEVGNALTNTLGSPAQVHFQNLTHVHPRRYTQGVQHDVHRGAVRHVRHVFHRSDARNHTLVAVTAGHLVTRLQTTLHGQIDLDHLQ